MKMKIRFFAYPSFFNVLVYWNEVVILLQKWFLVFFLIYLII